MIFFINLDRRICSSLYADDGAIGIRGRDDTNVLKKIKEAILKVEQWSYNWGFKLSPAKCCYMYFTRKRKIGEQSLNLYGQPIEKVKEFKYLGI